eukprot:gene57220-biopygen20116
MLAGMLPLVEGMPVALTEHIDKGRQLLKGTEGTLTGLWLDAEESSSASGPDGEIVLNNVLAQIRANQRHHQRPCSICKEDLSVDAFTPDHFRRGDDVRACIGCTQSRAQKEMKQREREAAVCSRCGQCKRAHFSDYQWHCGDDKICERCLAQDVRSRNRDRINEAAMCASCGQCKRTDFSENQWRKFGDDKTCNRCLLKQASARAATAFTCSACGKDRGKAGFGAKELNKGAAKRCLQLVASCGGDAGRDDVRALWRRDMTDAQRGGESRCAPADELE